jgi:hypothetical protein
MDRNRTPTALAGVEPAAGAQHPAVQRQQFFLSESRWDPEQRLVLLLWAYGADTSTPPTPPAPWPGTGRVIPATAT